MIGAIASALVSVALASAQEAPRLVGGALPPIPEVTVGGGEVIFDVEVDARGVVRAIMPLRLSEPYGQIMRDTVAAWEFVPATVDGRPVPGRLLIAAVFRPPLLLDAPTLGTPPVDVERPSAAVPFPLEIVTPPYPPLAITDAAVAIEVVIDEAGNVAHAVIVGGEDPFASAALDAAWRWRFRPAEEAGAPAPAVAYLVFGFRRPVVTIPGPRPRPRLDR